MVSMLIDSPDLHVSTFTNWSLKLTLHNEMKFCRARYITKRQLLSDTEMSSSNEPGFAEKTFNEVHQFASVSVN